MNELFLNYDEYEIFYFFIVYLFIHLSSYLPLLLLFIILPEELVLSEDASLPPAGTASVSKGN